jgi:anti-sigma B factor antagonist
VPDLYAEQAGTVRVIVLRREHDVSTIRRLKVALAAAIDASDGVVVDLSACTFIDSSSLAVLFHACQSAPVGRFGVIVAPDTEPSRLLDLVAFGAVVPNYATRDAGVAAVGARPAAAGSCGGACMDRA